MKLLFENGFLCVFLLMFTVANAMQNASEPIPPGAPPPPLPQQPQTWTLAAEQLAGNAAHAFPRTQTLDSVVVPIEVLRAEEIIVATHAEQQNDKKNQTRGVFTAEERLFYVNEAKTKSQQEVIRNFNRDHKDKVLTTSTLSYWVQKSKDGDDLQTKKRGPKEMLTEEEKKIILCAFDRFRVRAMKVDCALFAAAARGIVKRKRPSLFLHEGVNGYRCFSLNWARTFMIAAGLKPGKATTNRSIPCADIVAAGKPFYEKIQSYGAHPSLTFNADEFFCLLNSDNKSWSWYRYIKGKPQNIPVREDRVGFTCTVVSSADGSIEFLQLIWKGKTVNCEARVADDDRDELIVQDHQEHSHFQTAETWDRLTNLLTERIAAKRRRLNLLNDKALFIYDHAGQHTTEAAMEEKFRKVGCGLLFIPPKMTHCFQPADMFIISCIKSHANTAWLRWVTDTFAKASTLDAAVDEISATGNTTVKKQRKYKFLSEALRLLGNTESVIASWEASGILRAMNIPPRMKDSPNGPVPRQPVLYDSYVELLQIIGDAKAEVNEVTQIPNEEQQAVPPSQAIPHQPETTQNHAIAPTQVNAKKRVGRPTLAQRFAVERPKTTLDKWFSPKPRIEVPQGQPEEVQAAVNEGQPEEAQEAVNEDQPEEVHAASAVQEMPNVPTLAPPSLDDPQSSGDESA